MNDLAGNGPAEIERRFECEGTELELNEAMSEPQMISHRQSEQSGIMFEQKSIRNYLESEHEIRNIQTIPFKHESNYS